MSGVSLGAGATHPGRLPPRGRSRNADLDMPGRSFFRLVVATPFAEDTPERLLQRHAELEGAVAERADHRLGGRRRRAGAVPAPPPAGRARRFGEAQSRYMAQSAPLRPIVIRTTTSVSVKCSVSL